MTPADDNITETGLQLSKANLPVMKPLTLCQFGGNSLLFCFAPEPVNEPNGTQLLGPWCTGKRKALNVS